GIDGHLIQPHDKLAKIHFSYLLVIIIFVTPRKWSGPLPGAAPKGGPRERRSGQGRPPPGRRPDHASLGHILATLRIPLRLHSFAAVDASDLDVRTHRICLVSPSPSAFWTRQFCDYHVTKSNLAPASLALHRGHRLMRIDCVILTAKIAMIIDEPSVFGLL